MGNLFVAYLFSREFPVRGCEPQGSDKVQHLERLLLSEGISALLSANIAATTAGHAAAATVSATALAIDVGRETSANKETFLAADTTVGIEVTVWRTADASGARWANLGAGLSIARAVIAQANAVPTEIARKATDTAAADRGKDAIGFVPICRDDKSQT